MLGETVQVRLSRLYHFIQGRDDLVLGLDVDIALEVQVFNLIFLVWHLDCLNLGSGTIRHDGWCNQNDLALLEHLNACVSGTRLSSRGMH